MKIRRTAIALMIICLLGIEPSNYVYAYADDSKEIEFYQGEEEENSEAIANVDSVGSEDPGTGRYQGNIPEGFFDENGVQTYSESVIHNSRFDGYAIKKGIDVSTWNGTIDWKKVGDDGIEFAIIRGAYRGYGDQGTLVKDDKAAYNFEQAEKAGIPVGAYIFSQAVTEEEAVEEANYLLNIVKGYDITLPLVLDFEYASDGNGLTGRLYNADLSVEEATAVCRAFCKTVEDAGYNAMVYANKDMLENDLQASQISKDYLVWLAHYTSMTDYRGEYDFWQYTSAGKVDGISGNVDLNYWYVEPDQTKELIQENGEWLYYVNGVFQSNFTGLVKIDNRWYYILSGKWQSGYTGLVEYDTGTQYYVKDGTIQHGFTGLIKLGNRWYYILDGKWQSNYTGLVEYTSGTQYYVKSGIIQHGFSGLIKISNTWYYIVGGRWQQDYTGLAEYSSGTYYYVEAGVIRHDFTGLKKLGDVWYYIINGRWQSGFTGLAKYNTGSWYYVDEGVIDYSFNGIVKQGSCTYYVKSGKWQKGFDGKIVIDGTNYTVANGLIV